MLLITYQIIRVGICDTHASSKYNIRFKNEKLIITNVKTNKVISFQYFINEFIKDRYDKLLNKSKVKYVDCVLYDDYYKANILLKSDEYVEIKVAKGWNGDVYCTNIETFNEMMEDFVNEFVEFEK